MLRDPEYFNTGIYLLPALDNILSCLDLEKVAPKMKGITSMSVKASHFFLICVAEFCIRIRNWNFLRMSSPDPEPDPTFLSCYHYH
jgi:hypothetical protein